MLIMCYLFHYFIVFCFWHWVNHILFWHHLQVLAQPFILQSQLYSSVKDRTQVDRDLEVLFKLMLLLFIYDMFFCLCYCIGL
jgi:hypothetical protein